MKKKKENSNAWIKPRKLWNVRKDEERKEENSNAWIKPKKLWN